MTSHTPLDTDNWQYVDNYFKNPGDYSKVFSAIPETIHMISTTHSTITTDSL